MSEWRVTCNQYRIIRESVNKLVGQSVGWSVQINLIIMNNDYLVAWQMSE